MGQYEKKPSAHCLSAKRKCRVQLMPEVMRNWLGGSIKKGYWGLTKMEKGKQFTTEEPQGMWLRLAFDLENNDTACGRKLKAAIPPYHSHGPSQLLRILEQ